MLTFNMDTSEKRKFGEDAPVQEIKFELTTNLFVVVCVFKNNLYVHIRKYEKRYPTKEGVCMNADEWAFVAEVLSREGDKKISSPFGSVLVKRNRNRTATVTSAVRGTSVYLTEGAVANISLR